MNFYRLELFREKGYKESGQPVKGTLVLINNLTNRDIIAVRTIELPWKNNQNGVSCIIEGVYPFEVLAQSSNFDYKHIHIKNVPGRSYIKIHIANYAAGKRVQLRGCIAPGYAYGDIDGDGIPEILRSSYAMEDLMKHFNVGDVGSITVMEASE